MSSIKDKSLETKTEYRKGKKAEEKEKTGGDINLVLVAEDKSETDWKKMRLMVEKEANEMKGVHKLPPESIGYHEQAFALVKKWLNKEFRNKRKEAMLSEDEIEKGKWQPHWGIDFTPNMRTLGRVIGEEFLCAEDVRGSYRIDCDLYEGEPNDPDTQKGPHFNALICMQGPTGDLEKYAFKYNTFTIADECITRGPYKGMKKGNFEAIRWQLNKTWDTIRYHDSAGYTETMPIRVAKKFLDIYEFSKEQPGDSSETIKTRKDYARHFSFYREDCLQSLITIAKKRTSGVREGAASTSSDSESLPPRTLISAPLSKTNFPAPFTQASSEMRSSELKESTNSINNGHQLMQEPLAGKHIISGGQSSVPMSLVDDAKEQVSVSSSSSSVAHLVPQVARYSASHPVLDVRKQRIVSVADEYEYEGGDFIPGWKRKDGDIGRHK